MTNLANKATEAVKSYRNEYVRNATVIAVRVAVVVAVVGGAAYASHKIKEAHKSTNES
jgi:hypothetical protein